ncbi:MAG: complex I subunit 5 family protein [Allosphingosinicella sp.]|uniref:complex I subunit 5 family protein n=1 Tax=Allosphingosinicella sp. TaxID=2823234 RepID=UPI0039551C62
MTWHHILLYAAPGLPIALTLLVLAPGARGALFRLLPFAPVPALAAAVLLPGGVEDPFPRTLLGAGMGLTETARIFLGVGALLWILAGIFAWATIAGERRERFAGFWLATLSGNMLLFVAADVVSFYLAFATLSLAAFGLVVHYGTAEARRAARIYLVLAVLGETMLLLGFLIGAQAAGTILIVDVRAALAEDFPARDLAVGLLVAGFGLKAGLMPLHVWLPLAHPAAPVPASAVLSGAIVKAGIYGLATFLPLEADLPGWSAALVALGLATAYLGVLFGVVQHRPKTVLAYSTLSQMGLVIVLLGSGFGSPGVGLVLAAATLYGAHHGLAKGALFLSVGLVEKSGRRSRGPVVLAAGVAALAIAGLPFTGGALAKLAIKGPMGEGAATLLVTLSAVGTTLLMLRFLQLLRRAAPAEGPPPAALLLPFLGCLAAALALPWLLFPGLTELTLGYAVTPASLWGALWPILVGAALMAGALRLPRRPELRIAEGDIVVPLERAFRLVLILMRRAERIRPPTLSMPEIPHFERAERVFARWPAAGALLLLACGLVALAAMA